MFEKEKIYIFSYRIAIILCILIYATKDDVLEKISILNINQEKNSNKKNDQRKQMDNSQSQKIQISSKCTNL